MESFQREPPVDEGAVSSIVNPLVPTIFHEPWWLAVASNGTYDEIVCQLNGAPVGRLPYIKRRSLGMASVGMPSLTHFLGPAIDLGSGSPTTRQNRAFSITRDLIAALPSAASIEFKLYGGIADTIAFQETGFSTDVQFTNEISPASPRVLWSGMRDKTRNVIRRAEEELEVVEERDPERFAAFYRANLERRRLRSFYDLRMVRGTVEECLKRNRGRILKAVDKGGACRAAVFTIWDARSEYYLMSTRRADAGNGASSLLVWDAIQHAAERNMVFDFDGMRTFDDMRFFVGFGGSVRPRYSVSRNSLSFQALSKIARCVGIWQ